MSTPTTTAALTAIDYCGGESNSSAKGGFRLADGTTLWWVATRRNDFIGTAEMERADPGITLTREDLGNREAMDKITATCIGAVAILP